VALAQGCGWRSQKTMEEIMRVLTLVELMRLSRIELCDLLSQVTKSLPELSIGTIERNHALTNLLNIVRILSGRELARG
jgi:hypothetical protein